MLTTGTAIRSRAIPCRACMLTTSAPSTWSEFSKPISDRASLADWAISRMIWEPEGVRTWLAPRNTRPKNGSANSRDASSHITKAAEPVRRRSFRRVARCRT